MKILFVASEVFPLIKTGGLGDVASALPAALAAKGEDIRIIMPAYPQVLDLVYSLTAGHEHDKNSGISLGDPFGVGEVHLFETTLPDTNVPLMLIDCPELYARPGNPYLQHTGEDWPDNHLRFALLGWAAAKCATRGNVTGWVPDIVHANDWQAGLTAAYLHYWSGHAPRPKTVFTIHNIQYQGLFPSHILPEIGMPGEAFTIDGLEYWDQVSFLKAGISFSDAVTTVSPTYAQEIKSPAYGMGMEGLLEERAIKLYGILNGIDTRVWDPETDHWIDHHYDRRKLSPKKLNKEAIQRELHLPVKKSAPLLSMVTRLTDQKGVDMLVDILPELARRGAQVLVLGAGDEVWEKALRTLADDFENIAVRIGYFESLAHRIIAGSDMFLMPSRFEPCGLTQMYALRYGTLPIVRRTGGLADTVVDMGPDDKGWDGQGTGFVFEDATPAALLEAVLRALELYKDKKEWSKAQRRAMSRDFGWDSASEVYKSLYTNLVNRDVPTPPIDSTNP